MVSKALSVTDGLHPFLEAWGLYLLHNSIIFPPGHPKIIILGMGRLSPSGFCKKCRRRRGLSTTDMSFSGFWRLQVQDRGCRHGRGGALRGYRCLSASYRVERVRQLCESFNKTTDPIHGVHPRDLIASLRPQPQTTPHRG